MADSAHKPLFSEFSPVSTEQWQEKILKDLKGKPIDRLNWRTPDGFTLAPFYRQADLDASSLDQAPGEAPFRRGSIFHADEPGWQVVQPIAAEGEPAQRLQEALDAEVGAVALNGAHRNLRELLGQYPLLQKALHLSPDKAPQLTMADVAMLRSAQGLPPEHLTGTLTFDPILRSALIGQNVDDHALAALSAAIEQGRDFPYFRTLGIDLRLAGDLGATASSQLALALAAVVEYFDRLPQHNDTHSEGFLAENLTFTFPVEGQFFLELSKFRAFRLLIAQILGAYGLDAPGLLSPFVIAVSGRRNLSHYDQYNNLLRHTTAAMAAILGGAEAVALEAFDVLEPNSGRTGARLARNIQFLLKHESYFDQVSDVAGGAYYVEQVTEELAQQAWQQFQAIEAAGGITAYAKAGQLQTLVGGQSLNETEAFAKRKAALIGVNASPNANEVRPDLNLADEIPRLATAYEALRSEVDRFGEQRGKRLTAFLWQFGDVRMRNARAQFARDLMAAGGFAIEENQSLDDLEAAAQQVVQTKPDVVVLCSADPAYFDRGTGLIQNLKRSLPACQVVVAGKPDDWETTGADHCIYAGMNVLAFLQELAQPMMNEEN